MSEGVDLTPSIRKFIQSFSQEDRREVQLDKDTVDSIEGRSATAQQDIVHWLQTYSVLMGFTTPVRTAICEAILQFAWREGRPKNLNGKEEILAEFGDLKKCISRAVHVDGTPPRVITSLCSKALWCCYPHDVPLYDRNARYALKVLTRLADVAPAHDADDPYRSFLADWFEMYGVFLASADDEAIKNLCGYRVRGFDRYLWFLGNP